jgi:predicted  nucleic acid-binding Zn-ribbon protein
MEASQSKLEAAKNSKEKYKRRLGERNNELEILINENSDLHHQIGDQTRELGALKKGKGKLIEELSKKEKYIEELGSSSDSRIRSLNSAYDGLKKKFEEQQQQHRRLDGKHDNAVRLEAELERKMTEIEEMRHHQDEYATSFTALEQEVKALRDDKRAFEKLVATLQEKIRHLEVLEEWEEPSELNRTTSPRHITIQDGPYDTAPSSPMSSHTRSSIGHVSIQHERPQTSASTVSHEEDLDSWAMQVEKIRMQRNDAAVQLKGMKKSRHNLKKTLRDTDAQLHRIERETKIRRPQNLLRKKSRPITPNPLITSQARTSPSPRIGASSPQTPTRPTTSHNFSFSPRSTVNANSRHSTYITTTTPDKGATPSTPERPKTSHSLRKRLSYRATPSGGDEHAGVSPGERRHVRRWSSGLRSLFHKHA